MNWDDAIPQMEQFIATKNIKIFTKNMTIITRNAETFTNVQYTVFEKINCRKIIQYLNY